MSTLITLPANMLREVEQLAERDGRTVSDLLQEAVRRLLIQSKLGELQDYGRQMSEKLGLQQDDVERLIHEYRRGKREAQP